jgi:allophanate hydrolase
LPSGVTFVGAWGQDAALLALANSFHGRLGTTMGATGVLVPRSEKGHVSGGGMEGVEGREARAIAVAVVGAHLSGEPLNGQLVELGAHLVRTCRTAAHYRLYALAGTTPPKPGLLCVDEGSGAPIEVEVWELDRAAFGAFFRRVKAPLCIGTVELEDGEKVAGFLCEAHATRGAKDITSFGGWRAYRAR